MKDITRQILTAFIAGEPLQWRTIGEESWSDEYRTADIMYVLKCIEDKSGGFEIRVKPKTIIVNGVEVPAPLKEMPLKGTQVYVPNVSNESYFFTFVWDGYHPAEIRAFERGVLYDNAEGAEARGKAMSLCVEPRENT